MMRQLYLCTLINNIVKWVVTWTGSINCQFNFSFFSLLWNFCAVSSITYFKFIAFIPPILIIKFMYLNFIVHVTDYCWIIAMEWICCIFKLLKIKEKISLLQSIVVWNIEKGNLITILKYVHHAVEFQWILASSSYRFWKYKL